MKIDLTDFLSLQAELDAEIAKNHGVDYPSTHTRRVLALLVELGEFANETRCFKYWSFKPASPKEVVLDEFADGMHFFLSLAVALGIPEISYDLATTEKDLSSQLVRVYREVSILHDDYTRERFHEAFSDYLSCLLFLGDSSEDAREAYLGKLSTNHKRQETNY